jgi:predicted  nucleic acid-binding Zn-ribbon protein
MNACETKVYKSPKQKLLRFFERSRNQWKIKCKAAKATVKRLNNRVRYLENSKADWKSKAIELEKELAEMKTRESRAPETGNVKKTTN